MKKSLAVCLLLTAGAANAVPITVAHKISSTDSVGYTDFTVTREGLFTLAATNRFDGMRYSNRTLRVDPQMLIFRDDGDLTTDDYVAGDDDGGNGRNSLLSNFFLSTGSYIATVSDWSFTIHEAIGGMNGSITPGIVDLTISAGSAYENGLSGYTPEARLESRLSVPEPTSLALIALGFAAAVGVRRKVLAKV